MWPACGTVLINQTNCSRVPRLASPHVVTVDEVIELYIISLLCFVGLVGNAVSFAVFSFDKENRLVVFLLQVLAVADSLYLLVAVLRYPLQHLLQREDYQAMQPYVYPLLKTFQTIAIWMVMLVTLDRYVCMRNPFRAPQIFNKRSRRGYAALVYVLGFVFNLPRYFDSCMVKYINTCSGLSTTIVTYTPTFKSRYYFDIYLFGMCIIFLYLAPLTMLCVVNGRLILTIRRSRRRQSATSIQRATNADYNATLVLIIIVAIFIICETPELILRLLTFLDRHLKSHRIFSRHQINFNTFSELLMVINSSVNFMIYFICGKRFRKIFKDTFMIKFQSNATAITNELIPLHLIQQNPTPLQGRA